MRRSGAMVLALTGLGVACSLDFASGPRGVAPPSDGGGVPDATPIRDAGVEPLNDPARWEFFDLDLVIPSGLATPPQFAAPAFDGRYLYLFPADHQVVLRFDTKESVGNTKAWQSLILPSPMNIASAVVCSGILFFASRTDDVVGQYTVGDSFEPKALVFQDLQPGDVAEGFAGAACSDGTVYLAPANDGPAAYRSASAAAGAVWPRGPTGRFRGAVAFLGGGVAVEAAKPVLRTMFGPGASSLVANEFRNNLDWMTGDFDLAPYGLGGGRVYDGAVYDGARVYLVPSAGQQVARLRDPRNPRVAASWDLGPTVESPSMRGGVFDGRFVYFGPADATILARYDTQRDFATASSYETFDVRTLMTDALAPSFGRVAFDGQFVYLVPSATSKILARYRTDAVGMPPSFMGSFY